jgi:hypothetical protein
VRGRVTKFVGGGERGGAGKGQRGGEGVDSDVRLTVGKRIRGWKGVEGGERAGDGSAPVHSVARRKSVFVLPHSWRSGGRHFSADVEEEGGGSRGGGDGDLIGVGVDAAAQGQGHR